MLKLVTSTKNRMKALRARRDRGATAAEYALIVSLILAALVGIIAIFTGALNTAFTNIANTLT